MANDCEFIMKIVGEKRDCEEFVSRMQYDENPYHFHRIFNVDVSDYQYEDKSCYAFGDCAWSLETCCRAFGYSNGTDLFSVNTEELNLKIEAYSRELGIGFEEHYIYDRGCCLSDECLNVSSYYWDKSDYETYEEYIKDNPGAPGEEYFDENDEAIVGGFGEEYGIWHISCNDESDELGESMKALTDQKVALVDLNGEYRSTYDIVKDVAAVWDEMTSKEQAAIQQAILFGESMEEANELEKAVTTNLRNVCDYSETDDYHDEAHEDSIEEDDPISEFFKAFEEAKSALIQTEN